MYIGTVLEYSDYVVLFGKKIIKYSLLIAFNNSAIIIIINLF